MKLIQVLGLVGIPGSARGGLIWLLRQLKGQPVTKASRDANGQIVVRYPSKSGDETSVVVPADVLRLYQEVAVQRELGTLLDTLQNEAIETISYFPKNDPDQPEPCPSVVLTKADRSIVQSVDPPAETVIDTTQPMALSIRSLAFTEGNKWRLFDGQNVIVATIEDKDFLGRVERSIARFAKGDVLICVVRTVQKQTMDGLKTEHTVLRVKERKPAPTQLAISFEPVVSRTDDDD